MYNKFKSILKDDAFFYSAVIVLVAVSCFGLGRWSVSDSLKNSTDIGVKAIKVTQQASAALSQRVGSASATPKIETRTNASTVGELVTQKKYVGSKTGTKYHLLTCAGAKTIKDANKIYFSSKEDAEKQGYKPASNCKGI